VYTPKPNAESRPEVIAAFMRAHPLAAIVTASTEGGLTATHLPFVLRKDGGPHGTLEAHFARANPHHRVAAGDALVIFTGPDAYITPTWYPGKVTHGREVPTWNYVAVHAHGAVRLIEDPDWLLAHLERLSAQSEAGHAPEWKVSDAPREYVDRLLGAIVGIEIPVARIEARWKMSQNRSPEEIDGVIAGLGERQRANDAAVAAIVTERRPR
jgi:transcriptional regulator